MLGTGKKMGSKFEVGRSGTSEETEEEKKKELLVLWELGVNSNKEQWAKFQNKANQHS